MKKIIITILGILILTLAFNTIASSQNIALRNFNSMKSYDVNLYPNPVTEDKFKVESEDLIKVVEVINVIGQIIHKQENEISSTDAIVVRLSNCEKGMYLVKVTFDDEKSIIKKLLVK